MVVEAERGRINRLDRLRVTPVSLVDELAIVFALAHAEQNEEKLSGALLVG